MTQELFNRHDAARYLGISESTVKYHIYKSGLLKPAIISGVAVFTKEQLDQHKESAPKRGWRTGRARKKAE